MFVIFALEAMAYLMVDGPAVEAAKLDGTRTA